MKSANEISNLGIKAARGAGFDIGLAQDFGAALALHLSAGRATHFITSALQDPNGPIAQMPCRIDALFDPQESGCDQFKGLALSYFQASQQVRAAPRIAIDPELESYLQELAARTYVPASEASRLAGAGAGLSDND